MPGFLNAARVTGGDTVTSMLRNYVLDAADLVAEAVEAEQADFVARQQERAQDDPRWSQVAQQLHGWQDDEGDWAFGVDDEQAVTQAGRLEFGDEQNPPTAFIRMGVYSDVSNMAIRLNERFRRGGY